MNEINGCEKLKTLPPQELKEMMVQKLEGIKDISRKLLMKLRNNYGYNGYPEVDMLQYLIEESDFISLYDEIKIGKNER